MKYVKTLAIYAVCLLLLACAGCSVAGADPAQEDVIDIPEPEHTAGQTPQTAAPQTSAPEEPAQSALSATPSPVPDDGLPYYLYVEKGSFTLTIYEKDEAGEYTKVYKTYRIAHGGNKTPAGAYTLGGESARERWHDFPDGGTVQYATKYEGRLYIHSPLYATADPTQMWPKYNNGDHGIGLESTGGCLRMVTEAAKFIYENCPEGTVLKIVNGSPLGTTSDEVPSRNGLRIDPTDYETLQAKGYGG